MTNFEQEVPLTHFMDMAYNMDRYTTPGSTAEWLERWASQEFHERVSHATAEILSRYGTLVARRKYELLSELPFAFSTIYYDEAERNLADWERLLEDTQSVYDSLDQATRTSFFEMVLHPVLAGKTVVDLYTKVALNRLYYAQGRTSTNLLAQQANDLFSKDAEITERYHSVHGGKWDHIIDQVHIGYTSWNDPADNTNVMPSLSYVQDTNNSGALGVSIQGSEAAYPEKNSLNLLSVDPYMPPTESRYIDVFARKNGTFTYTLSSNASYVTVLEEELSLTAPGNKSDCRNIITVDWETAPSGLSLVELTVTADDNSAMTLVLPVNKTSVLAGFSGFVESNGVISIEASHYTTAETKNGVEYIDIPDYGRTLSGVKPWPVTMGTQYSGTGPALRYSVYITTSSSTPRLIVSLGASHNHDPTRYIKFAYSLDGAEPVTVRPVSTVPPYKEGKDWRKAVVENGWTSTIELGTEMTIGVHEVSLWLLEPGVVLQKVVLDLGGYKATALGPPESRKIG